MTVDKPGATHPSRPLAAGLWLDAPPRAVASALLPMGGSISGVAGPNWMLIGDAAACVNPLNAEGIDYGLATGRLAAELLDSTDLFCRLASLLQHGPDHGHHGLTDRARLQAKGPDPLNY